MASILIVEDDRSSQRILAEVVRGLGHHAIIARDGEVAWTILQDNPDIRLILTDVVMPGVDGLELAARIRADEHLAELPVVVISGQVGPKRIADLLKNGMTRFIGKPLKPREIAATVRAYLPDQPATASV